MKKSILIISALAFVACSGNKNKRTSGFELQGNLTNSRGEIIYLEKLATQVPQKVDSCVIADNGNFSFDNFTPEIGFYRILINNQNFGMLVLDSTDKVTINGDAKDIGNTYKVEGSPETKLFLEYNELAKHNRSKIDSLQQAFQLAMHTVKMDSLRVDSLSKVFEKPYNELMESFSLVMSEKIKANSTMFSSIMAVQPLDPEKYSDVYKLLDDGLMSKFSNNENVKMFHQVVQRLTASKNGETAPEINLPDQNGNPVALSSFKGKVVLIDFWASWCGPCRREMPNVVAAYKKYKSKGFEIYGVSLDREKQDWLDAIKKDGITWTQVSDLKYWECEAAKLYNVQGIPYTVLLDKDGKIIAKNLRGAELDKKLAEVLK